MEGGLAGGMHAGGWMTPEVPNLVEIDNWGGRDFPAKTGPTVKAAPPKGAGDGMMFRGLPDGRQNNVIRFCVTFTANAVLLAR